MQREFTNGYRVFAGLPEDTDKGWVYLSLPDPPFKFRTTIEICNVDTKRSVFCEYRTLEGRFIRTYNDRPHNADIRPKDWTEEDRRTFKDDPQAFNDVLVISGWYRYALGIDDTNVKWERRIRSKQQYQGSVQVGVKDGEGKYGFLVETTQTPRKPKPEVTGEKPHLKIVKPSFPLWADIRASCHHPEPVVRLGTRLGILGTWLGLMGFLFGVLPDDLCVRLSVGLPVGIIFAAVGFIAGRGIPHYREPLLEETDHSE